MGRFGVGGMARSEIHQMKISLRKLGKTSKILPLFGNSEIKLYP